MSEFHLNADDPTHTLDQVWPPFGLLIESPRLILRQIRETDFPGYLAAASSGIMRTARNSFASPWDENSPEKMAKNSLTWLWSRRASIGPDSWYLMLAVFTKDEDGGERQLIGMQDVWGQKWRVLRTVNSGSWMRSDHQGRGLGKEMRAAMLMWAFDHFGAEYAESGAYDWNEASLGVSKSLGYFQSGTTRVTDAHGKQPEWEIQLRLPKNDFLRPSWTVQVQGNDLLKDFMLLSDRHLSEANDEENDDDAG
ncbi:GNAT family N-acetyltransferase [Nesterenkonia muleiensis]|uniref:GNAT family N-acetyltransferase n=1 Tax=Nesterenkonia muleiensis TaxID=2282648 RepID=UPI000E71B31B|nr:GNAT family N-acetyltransferase [Nesterenkonia muleiensis]